MATYTIDKRPKRLRPGDRIIFVVGGKKSEYCVLNGYNWLRGGDDEDVFENLEIDPFGKGSLAERSFGYTSLDPSFWPSAKPQDYAAHCRLVNALYDLIEEREGKKTESCSDKATDGPGVFLGYDWIPCNGNLGVGAELSPRTYETEDAACSGAGDKGFDTCLVFKLYAVDAKGYTRKFVQED